MVPHLCVERNVPGIPYGNGLKTVGTNLPQEQFLSHCGPRCVDREGAGNAFAAQPPLRFSFSPVVAWEAGQRGSGDGVAAGLGQVSSASPTTESLGHNLEAPKRLTNLGNHPPDRSVVGSGLGPKLVSHILGSPSTGCSSVPAPARAPPCAAVVAAVLSGVSWDALNTQRKWEVKRKQEILK